MYACVRVCTCVEYTHISNERDAMKSCLCEYVGGWVDGWVSGWMDGWIGWIGLDGWMDGWDGWMDARMYVCICLHVYACMHACMRVDVYCMVVFLRSCSPRLYK